MKILVINWQDWKNPYAGGAEVHLYEVFRRIQRRGHKVTILCCNGYGLKNKEIIHGIEIKRTGRRNFFNFQIYPRIKSFINNKNFDIIVDDLNKIPFYTPFFNNQKPVVAIVHHLFRKAIYKETSFAPATYVYLSESLIPCVYRKQMFIAVSHSTKKDLIDMGIPPQRIKVIPPGVDLKIFKPMKIKKENMILYVGRLKKYKSVDHLLLASSILKNKGFSFKLVIVGTGDDEYRLKNIASEWGLKKEVEFTGFLPVKELVEMYNKALFLVQPSVKEGWGLSVIEAGACKNTVIAADSPGLRDSVINGKTGLLYPYGDITKLVEYMKLLICNTKLRERLSYENYKWSSQFGWDNISLQILNILENAVKNCPS